jgi:hypothetical protein
MCGRYGDYCTLNTGTIERSVLVEHLFGHFRQKGCLFPNHRVVPTLSRADSNIPSFLAQNWKKFSQFFRSKITSNAVGFHGHIMYCPHVNVSRIFSIKLLPRACIYEMPKSEDSCKPGTRTWRELLQVVTMLVGLPSYA